MSGKTDWPSGYRTGMVGASSPLAQYSTTSLLDSPSTLKSRVSPRPSDSFLSAPSSRKRESNSPYVPAGSPLHYNANSIKTDSPNSFKMGYDEKILSFEDVEATGHWVAVRSTDNLEMITYEHHRYNPATSELICSYYRRFECGRSVSLSLFLNYSE